MSVILVLVFMSSAVIWQLVVVRQLFFVTVRACYFVNTMLVVVLSCMPLLVHMRQLIEEVLMNPLFMVEKQVTDLK